MFLKVLIVIKQPHWLQLQIVYIFMFSTSQDNTEITRYIICQVSIFQHPKW